jgi:RNA polymerase sigma factor (sigma-70 family)
MGRSPLAPEHTPDSAAIAGSFEHPESFAKIFDRHYVAVHRYLARRAPRAQADDLASMTFVVAFEQRRSFRPQSTSARPWLLGIATNLLRERARVERREHGTLVLLGSERSVVAGCPVAEASDGVQAGQLAHALATLDSAQRDVLLLHAWEELSYEEIAQALAVPLGTVRSRLARARAHLRTRLERPPSPSPADARSTDD